MYACIHVPQITRRTQPALQELAVQFSPTHEWNGPGTLTFSLAGLTTLFGTAAEIASEIARRGMQLDLQGNLAIAANPDTALQAARNFPGVTVIPPGHERATLSDLDIRRLPLPEAMHETLASWGVRTYGEFAELPPLGVVERLGAEGLRWQDIARGAGSRAYLPAREAIEFRRHTDLDHALDNLQPLLFLLNGLIRELARELERHGVSARQLQIELGQGRHPAYQRMLEFPVPLRQPEALFKLAQLDLEANPPLHAITAVGIAITPMAPQVAQGGLFTATAPEPAQLQITLARVAAIVGEDNVGAPELLDTHRPDAYLLKPYNPAAPFKAHARKPAALTLAIRIYRPPRQAKVTLDKGHPARIAAAGVTGNVISHAGPWRASGDWWTHTLYAREEWDVSLTDGGLYRVHLEPIDRWFVSGVYD
jgi:protein ImuB